MGPRLRGDDVVFAGRESNSARPSTDQPRQAQLGGAEGDLLAGVAERHDALAELGAVEARAVGGAQIAERQPLPRIVDDLRVRARDAVVVDDELRAVAVAADGPRR